MSPKKVAKKAAKKAAKKTAKKVAKKAATKKAAAKKSAAASKAPARKSAAKKPAARKPAAKKAAAKKPAPKKTAAKKAEANKAPAKKTVAKAPAATKAASTQPAAPRSKAKKYEQKTKPIGESVDEHIRAIADPGRRQDCRTLVEVFSKATGRVPKMWGPSIVAFGKYHYKYGSGHEGDSCLAGFASRKGALSLYLMGAVDEEKELMARLGKHQTGKGCIYLKNLDGIDLEVLGELVKRSAEYIRQRYPVSD